MTKLNNKTNDYHKRAIFPSGQQRDFLENTQSQLKLTLKEFSKLAGIHTRSMTDWKREKFSMSLPVLEKLCKKTKKRLPKNIKIKDPFWYASKGSKKGWIKVCQKYGHVGGDPKYRIKKWHEWWKKEGKFKKHPVIGVYLPINIPKKSKDLAELTGIILGDGNISQRQVTITLNKIDDKDYINYVCNLFKKLFRVNPSIHTRKKSNAENSIVSRSRLVNFLTKNGLKIGGKVKQQVKVPSWINNSETFVKSCLRGLFDTDGCFYIDKHLYKNKQYLNCGMNFTNRSLPILYFFKNKLEKFNFHPTQKTKFSIFLRREKEIIQYFQKIGSSNPKHLKKFKNYFKNKYGEVPKWS